MNYSLEEIQAFKEEIQLIELEIKLEEDYDKVLSLKREIEYIQDIVNNAT